MKREYSTTERRLLLAGAERATPWMRVTFEPPRRSWGILRVLTWVLGGAALGGLLGMVGGS